MRQWWIAMGLLAATLPGMAAGWRPVLSPVTPLTPPIGFVWLIWVFLALLVIANVWVLVRLDGSPLEPAIGRVLGTTFLFILVVLVTFFLVSVRGQHAPPPLAIGGRIAWGDHLSRFVQWNGLLLIAAITAGAATERGYWQRRPAAETTPSKGKWILWLRTVLFVLASPILLFAFCFSPESLIMIASLLALLYYVREPRALRRAGATAVVWVLCMLPFAVFGAFTHVSGGDYLCREQQAILARGIVQYAQAHNGVLPRAAGTEQLCTVIEEQLKGVHNSYMVLSYMDCPIGSRYESTPLPLVWNAALSGRKLKDIEALDPPPPVFGCPYHDGKDGLLRIEVTTAQLRDLEKPVKAFGLSTPGNWPKLP
jgi:hypothetical protein